MYIEIVEHNITDRGKIIPVAELTREPRAHELYVTHFPFAKEIIDYVKRTGSVKQFPGNHYCNYFVVDIDREDDIEEARRESLLIMDKWLADYGLSPSDVFVYFSGNKGFHLVLHKKTFGDVDPSPEMGNIIKRAVLELTNGFNIDTTVYNNGRLMRVENSLNVKSGLYKIQLTYDELFSMSIDEIRELAKQPRTLKLKRNLQINDAISRIVKSSTHKDDKDDPVTDGFFLPTGKGDRNNKLYRQAFFLFVNTSLHETSIKEIVYSINQASPSPLPEHEVNSIINSARTNRKETTDELRVSMFSDLWEAWIDSLRVENNKIDLVFRSLNDEFKGKCRGQLGVVLGYGGSKKSMYGQNVCVVNILAGIRTVYSNMEMGTSQLAARFIDIVMDGFDNFLPTDFAAKEYYEGKPLDGALSFMKKTMSDKLIVCENSNMTSDRYDQLLTRIKQESGDVDLLVVDGMSMMGGSGTETELANKHSKELKELAKKWNILVLVIVHASKGEDLTTRDLTRKARASEKIADNSDWIMTLSQIKIQGDKYAHKAGKYHLWNKRGSGRRVEHIWEFGAATLRMHESDKDIAQFENTEDF